MSINTDNLASLDEIDTFEKTLQSFQQGNIDPERFTAMRLQFGVYGQRQEGVNMLRVKVPGGRITPSQLESLADVTELYAKVDHANITTRQSIQIHHIPLEQTPDAMRRMAQAGLTTREACSNTIRNLTACPLAGVCPREHTDVGVHVDAATLHFLRNPLTQQMPRKFKIAFSGCEADCAQTLLHDAGLVATVQDGKQGFIVKAGGGLGHKPHEAIVVDEFVLESEVLYALEALVTLHNKYSDRTKRAKSRIKFLVERFGADDFRAKYREEFARTREALASKPQPKAEWRTPEDVPAPGQGAPRAVLEQRQPGLFVLPLSVPLGELSVAQLRGIAQVLRAQGLEEVHTSQDQNLTIVNVPQARLDDLRSSLSALGLKEPQRGDSVVACPGSSTCRLGITSSTIVAPKLSGGLNDISIRVSGCQNGCAQPETGEIGIYGEGRRMHGKLVPHYQTFFGGSGMAGGGLGIKGPSVPAARVVQAVTRVEETFAASGEESFSSWARKQESDYFKTLLADIIEVKAEELVSVMRDHGQEADFKVLNFGGGECAGASQVQIGANFFEAAHEREYRRALMFQRKYAEAAQCSEAILRQLAGGLVQLLDGIRQDDTSVFASRIAHHGQEAIAKDFSSLTEQLQALQEPEEADVAALNKAVDEWTVRVAGFCLEKDAQLDLDEALPGVAA